MAITPWRSRAGRAAVAAYAVRGLGRMYGYARTGMSLYRTGKRVAEQFRPAAKKQRVITSSITEQRDYTRMYRRRRAPRRVRRRARKSFQRFTYHLDKSQGMVTTKINNFLNVTTSPSAWNSDAVGTHSVTMFGTANNVNSSDPNNDLARIYYDATGALPTSADASQKLRFRSCVLDFQLQNNGDGDVYVEAWHCLSRKNGTVSPLVAFSNAIAEQQGTAGPVATGITSIGCYKLTPFDAPGFGKYWIVKQTKKYYIQAGQSFSFQIRDAKNYIISGDQILPEKALPGITEGVMFRVYGADLAAESGSGDAANWALPSAANVDISCVKTYHWTRTMDANNTVGTVINGG